MEVRKCVRIPVHYRTTKSKVDRLDKLTARLTYCITLINSQVTKDTKLDRLAIRKLVRESDVVARSKLSAGFVDQCIDKVLWSWKSYKKLQPIGNTRFRQTQYRGNHMPTMRKRVGKWSYGRQRNNIALKRAERGLPTKLMDERNTSNTCHCCGSRLVTRKYLDGASWILCHSCGAKLDVDLNAAYNIALRCQDDRLKVRMNPQERASA